MRLGLMLSGARTAPDAVRVARRAEQAGIAEIWVSEDYFERGAFAVAAAVAAGTDAAQVGIGVVNPWTRHPMVTAMEFAALDELAGGRAVLGMGASNPVWMQQRCGIPFRAPLAAVRESVTAIRDALAGRRVDLRGEHFTIDAALSFTPARTAPIHLGAKGRRSLLLAREIADGVLLSLLSSPAYITWARRQAGPHLWTGAYVLAACDADATAARAAVRPALATYLGVHGAHDITRIAGLDAETAEKFRAGWLAGSPATELVDDEMIDTFTVAGDLDGCLHGLQRLQAAGLDAAVLRDPGDAGIDGLLERATRHRTDAPPAAAAPAGDVAGPHGAGG
jgi:5,10-methylenetetrahydromethanopterin reductase